MQKLCRATVIVIIALLLSAQTVDYSSLDERFERGVLIISTAENGCFKFDIHLAINNEQQMRGLMFIRELPEWSGMLFVYKRAGIRSMWMKNTFVPLDILFARGDGTVSSIETHTEPQSLKSISAVEPVNYVLELNAGTTERLGIGAGSVLILDD